jgi:glycosyltransferase involved in cell wall biosynthesis
MLSVVIPARNEPFVAETVTDLLTHAQGPVEVIVVLDGPCATPPRWPEDPRLKVIVHETPHGMRPSINEAVGVAQGDAILKCDAHCAFSPGYDTALTLELEPSWVVVPRRYSLDPTRWAVLFDERPRDAHTLEWPFKVPNAPVLRARTWHERGAARAHVLLDDELSSQGSCWVMSRSQWERVGPLDAAHYGPFIQEFQEIGFKTWLSGGRVKVNKQTWYAHWYKRTGQGYALSKRESREGIAFSMRQWFHDEWDGPRVRTFASLIDQFGPLPGWPDDWQARQRT